MSFRATSIEDLAVPADSADAVLGLSILHLVRDLDGALAKVHAMLKPGASSCPRPHVWATG